MDRVGGQARRAGKLNADRLAGSREAPSRERGQAERSSWSRILAALLITPKTGTVFVLTFLANLGYGVMIPSLALHAHSTGATNSSVGMIVSAFAAAQLLTQIPVGRLSDRIGRRFLIAAGFLGVAVAAALYNFATGTGHFLLLQGFAGLSIGLVWPPLMALLTDDVGPSERGKLMGIFNTVFFIGVGVGPLMGGFIAAQYGHMAAFSVWAVISALAAVFCLVTLKDPPQTKTEAARRGGHAPMVSGGLLKPGFAPTFAAACAVRARGGFCTSFNNALLPIYAVGLFSATPQMIGGLMFTHGLMLAFFNLPGWAHDGPGRPPMARGPGLAGRDGGGPVVRGADRLLVARGGRGASRRRLRLRDARDCGPDRRRVQPRAPRGGVRLFSHLVPHRDGPRGLGFWLCVGPRGALGRRPGLGDDQPGPLPRGHHHAGDEDPGAGRRSRRAGVKTGSSRTRTSRHSAVRTPRVFGLTRSRAARESASSRKGGIHGRAMAGGGSGPLG